MSQDKKIPKLQNFQLPSRLPHKETLNSLKHNECHYSPDFWELEYLTDRYLENVDEECLNERYQSIAKNLCRLVSEECHAIPINNFLSSWYWYRKEHQTRVEFYLRGLPLPSTMPEPSPIKQDAEFPLLPRHPNAGDAIFRFGSSKYMKPMVEQGQVRIGPASQYIEGTPGDPRTDDELNKHAFLSGKHSRITTLSGKTLSVIGDVQRTVSSQNYYVLCSSCGYHPELFNDFSADCCVVIRNPEEFARRIDLAFREQLDEDLYFYHNPVEYFDPYEMHHNQPLDAVICKDFSYAYQMEYRFVWFSLKIVPADGYLYLDLGSLQDIASLYMRPSA